MNSIQTQTLSINGDGGGEAYIDFCDGQLCVSLQKENRRIFTLILLRQGCLPMLINCIVNSVKIIERITMKVLRNETPVARKEHRCNFCGGVISVGEKYNRQTNVYDGCVYDWVSHCECSKLACELDMFDDCDEGLDDDGFIDRLNQYVYDNHYDDKIDDIAKDWQLPRYELVKKVLNELNKKQL